MSGALGLGQSLARSGMGGGRAGEREDADVQTRGEETGPCLCRNPERRTEGGGMSNTLADS